MKKTRSEKQEQEREREHQKGKKTKNIEETVGRGKVHLVMFSTCCEMAGKKK